MCLRQGIYKQGCHKVPSCPLTCGVSQDLFAVDTCIYATDRKGGYILRELHQAVTAVETWCEHCNIKLNEDKTQAIYFSYRPRLPEAHLALNGWNIPFVNHVKYLCVIFDKTITWILHVEVIEATAFRAFISIYSQFRSNCLNANSKLTLHKALITRAMIYACPVWELAADTSLKDAMPAEQGSSHHWKFSKVHMALSYPYTYDYITDVQATSRSHSESREWTCS
jgi:hypothetical protein